MNDLKEIAKKHKIEYIACIPVENIEGYRSVCVMLIPYYCGEHGSYLSKYTRCVDYHKFGRRIFDNILKEAGETEHKILIDASPLDENQWQTFSIGFNPTAKSPHTEFMKVRIYVYWPVGICYFDNVRIEEISKEEMLKLVKQRSEK